jgi:hypothetical protein
MELTPEDVEALVASDGAVPSKISLELLDVGYWVFTAVIRLVYHEKDLGKDARLVQPEKVKVNEILRILKEDGNLGGEEDRKRFFQTVPEGVRSEFIASLLELMGLDRLDQGPGVWRDPRSLGKTLGVLRDGAAARIKDLVNRDTAIVQVLGPSVIGQYSPEEQEMLAQLAALSEGRIVLQQKDLRATVEGIVRTPYAVIVQYRGSEKEFEDFEKAMKVPSARGIQVSYFYEGRFSFDLLLKRLLSNLLVPDVEMRLPSLVNDLRFLTQA